MVKPKQSRQSGFSLIEVMMAVLLLAVAFLALGQLVAVAVNQNALSRNKSVSIAVATGRLEMLRRIYNQQLAAGAVTLTDGTATETMRFEGSQGSESSTSSIGTFNVTWTVTPVVGSSNEYTVKVTARPTAQNNLQSKSVEIVSHFAP